MSSSLYTPEEIAREQARRKAIAELRRRDDLKRHKADCEESLLEFVKLMWPIVEPATKLVVGWPLSLICDILTSISDGHSIKDIINVPPGFSKALDIETPVLTTWGWKRHGDLREGDYVFGPDGAPSMITGLTEHRLEPCYDVTFDDGATLTAGRGHLWTVERDYPYGGPQSSRIRKPKVVETPDLIPSVAGRTLQRPDRIPVADPIRIAPRRFLIDPYVLGVWLGDGNTDSCTIGVGHEDIEHFSKMGRIATVHPPEGTRKQPFYRIIVEGLQEKLRILGLLKNKHIPDDYLESSIEQRWDLLRGLMDTDGCATAEGHCTFVTKLELMSEQIQTLACSLGIKAYRQQTWSNLNGERFGPYYPINFKAPPGTRVFNLERKQSRVRYPENTRSRGRYVTSVTPVGDRMVNCIMVEGALYLAGRRFVTTHNSYCVNVFWPAWEWGPQNKPWLRYLSASYSGELANRDNGGDVGRFARLIMSAEYRHLWGDRFKVVKNNAGLVENDKTGSKRVVTMSGGATTGFRGDRILIDDPNNPLDVESDTVRATTNTWLREVMPSRINDAAKSAIICIQQRTHEEDATGILVKYDGSYRWWVVPMHFDPLRMTDVTLQWDDDGRPVTVWKDPRGLDENKKRLEGLFTDARGVLRLRPGSPMAKAEGTLAWKERFSQEYLDKLATTLGTYAFENQFEQSPGVRGGGTVRRDWWQTWTKSDYPTFGTIIGSLDTAIEEGHKNDWNALQTWAAFAGDEGEPKIMLTSAARWRCQLAELVTRVYEICVYRKVDTLLIERRTRGKDVHDEILRQFATAPFQTILVDVTSTKMQRLRAVTSLFSGDLRRDMASGIDVYSGGMIWAPDRAWADEVIDEISSFPRGAHDDHVDSATMALGYMRRNGVVLRRVEWDEQEREARTYRRPMGVPYAIKRSA